MSNTFKKNIGLWYLDIFDFAAFNRWIGRHGLGDVIKIGNSQRGPHILSVTITDEKVYLLFCLQFPKNTKGLDVIGFELFFIPKDFNQIYYE